MFFGHILCFLDLEKSRTGILKKGRKNYNAYNETLTLRSTTMKKKIAFLVNFVQSHKVAFAVGLTATAFILLIMRNQRELNEFLKEHNLLEEFYALED